MTSDFSKSKQQPQEKRDRKQTLTLRLLCVHIWPLAAPPAVLARTPGRWSRSPSTVRHLRLGLESAAAE